MHAKLDNSQKKKTFVSKKKGKTIAYRDLVDFDGFWEHKHES